SRYDWLSRKRVNTISGQIHRFHFIVKGLPVYIQDLCCFGLIVVNLLQHFENGFILCLKCYILEVGGIVFFHQVGAEATRFHFRRRSGGSHFKRQAVHGHVLPIGSQQGGPPDHV